jgi:phosphohistidine swiveling domain-containing protein
MDIAEFKKHSDWTKISAGPSPLLCVFYLGKSLFHVHKIKGEPVFRIGMYIPQLGANEMWAPQAERDYLGQRLASLFRENNAYLDESISHLRHSSDELNALIRNTNPKTITAEQYQRIWDAWDEHYLPHVVVKYIADYLSPEELQKYFDPLQDVRKYIEPTYGNLLKRMWEIAETSSTVSGYPAHLLMSTIGPEFIEFLQNGPLPSQEILEERYQCSALLFDETDYQLFSGSPAREIERMISPNLSVSEIRGQTAYGGKVRGRVRVILDPTKGDAFEEGEILVTGMTRPDYLPIMQKAAAFVTDSGGVLTHAAISAREMKKPCVIGTDNATKILKTGDIVEIDADRGVIHIVK